jgi:hypothetical protein
MQAMSQRSRRVPGRPGSLNCLGSLRSPGGAASLKNFSTTGSLASPNSRGFPDDRKLSAMCGFLFSD